MEYILKVICPHCQSEKWRPEEESSYDNTHKAECSCKDCHKWFEITYQAIEIKKLNYID